jgi:predicted RNase H-like HicB family nuclease
VTVSISPKYCQNIKKFCRILIKEGQSMNTATYTARLSYCEDGICVTFPDVPGANTCADTKEEAIAMAKDALENWFSDGSELPPARRLDEVARHSTLRHDSALAGLEKNAEFVEIAFTV